MKCGICGKEMIKLADGVNYGCDYCNIQTLLYKPNTDMPIDSSQQYIDTLHKESSELLVNSLAEKDQQIAELQKQLEEKEKRIKELDNWKANYGYTNYEDIYMLEDLQSRAFQSEDDTQVVNELLDYLNISDENEILLAIKQQLRSQPAEIVEKIRKSIHYYPIALLDSNKELRIKTLGISKEVLDDLLKEYQKQEDNKDER